MATLVEFPLENGEKIFIEVSTPVKYDKGFQMAGDAVNNKVVKASETFERAVQKIKPAAVAIAETFKSLSPDELELSFGIKFTAEADVIISSVSTEINFDVKMTWKKGQS